MEISIAKQVVKELKKLPKASQKRIVSSIESLADDPRPRGVEKIKGRPEFLRVRCGDFRIVYHIFKGKVVLVLIVRDRKDAYDQHVIETLDVRRERMIATDPKVVRLASRGGL